MRQRDRQSGFSLVEVVIALGLLAGVLITISGLFIIGNRQVKSGRTQSEALAVAETILEEMDGWGFRQTYQLFGFDGTATSHSVDSRVNAYASKWQPVLDESLANSWAIVDITSLGTGPPTLATTKAIRVVVTVNWSEGARNRQVRVGTVRM